MAADVHNKKIKEGDKHIADAEKSLKTNWLKWNPDYDNASHSFDKAALCYRSAKEYDKAVESFERASDAYYKNHALFHSGKALEQAANVCRDQKNFDQAASFLERASLMYHESGHGDTAGQVLAKAAKIMEPVDPQKAAYYHLATADLHEIEEKYRDSCSAIRAAVNMYARARHLDTLLDALHRLRKTSDQLDQYKHIHEIVAIEVVVHLHNDDIVAAEGALDTASSGLSGFGDSDYAPVLQALVESYNEKDEEAFYRSCDDSIFRTMDNEIAKLTRDLKKKLDFTGFDSVQSSQANARPSLPEASQHDECEEEEAMPDIL